MRALLGQDADALFAALEHPSQRGLRVNTLKLSPESLLEHTPWSLTPIPWCPSGFVLEQEAEAGKHPFHSAGLYYLQEPSAMAVAEALNPQPGELVLDLAAAPGGKSTHLAALAQDQCVLVANDVKGNRLRVLGQNLERWGATHAVLTMEPLHRLAKQWGAQFDRVLLDAPCSGEGMFRKSPEAVAQWRESSVLGAARRQQKLIADAAQLVKPGGTLVYSTCTFAPEENEQVVARLLQDRPDFELIDPGLPGTASGRPDWVPRELRHAGLEHTVRLWPHKIKGEGHFIAVLRRQDDTRQTPPSKPASFNPVKAQVATLWHDFVQQTLTHDVSAGRSLTLFGDKLFAVPEGVPELRGLRATRTGLHLGTVKKDRLVPAHALALTLTPQDVQQSLDLHPESEPLARYLAGHELEHHGEDGWVLITSAGFALGWGRRARHIIKNAYPKGLRLP